MAIVEISDYRSPVRRFIGLSTDNKATITGTIPAGSTFYETDLFTTHIYASAAWSPLAGELGGIKTSKLVTFTGAAGAGAVGAVNVFAVTGDVEILRIVPFCTVSLEEAAPTATLALGLPGGSSALYIAATTATLIDAGTVWLSTSPQTRGIAVPASCKETVIVNGNDIQFTVAAQNITAGAIRTEVIWRPLSTNGLVAPA